MYRFLLAVVVGLLLGGGGSGCSQRSQLLPSERAAPPAAAVEAIPGEGASASQKWQQPMEVLGESLKQAQEQYERNGKLDLDKLLRALDDLWAALPGQPARFGLAQARVFLERRKPDQAMHSIDAVLAYLLEWEAYWPDSSSARPFLEAAREDVEAADPTRAMLELEQAEALLMAAELEVPRRGLQRALRRMALESGRKGLTGSDAAGSLVLQRLQEAQEQWAALQVTLTLMEVLRHVNMAHRHFLELARAETQAELEQAGKALAELKAERPTLGEEIREVEDDLAGIQRDLKKDMAGLEDRLTALGKKLKSLLRELGPSHVAPEKNASSVSPEL